MATSFTTNGMFLSEYTRGLDPQCRVSLPGEWRGIETEFVMLPTVGKSFLLLPVAMFRSLFETVSEQAIADVALQEAFAFLGSQARFCRCDKQGRMALDRELLDSVGVKKNLKLIGSFSHIRICAPENWTPPEDPEDYFNTIQEVSDGNDGLDVLGGLLGGVFGK
jgi:DNA-binding transcriptional regulator/RsmH inhibitor MraZ